MAKILISGGSGMIGRAVSELLLKGGHEVRWLSRGEGNSHGIRKFRWDPENNTIDARAFDGVNHLIHLAGAGIADHRWTAAYKKKIIQSRIKSAELLFNTLVRNGVKIDSLVGASAVGLYGAGSGGHVYTESDPPGNDFLSKVCVEWENSYQSFSEAGIRVAVIRTGIVLSQHGGAYKKLKPLFSKGLGAVVGNGNQAFPWIHIHDLAALYCEALFSENYRGAYNATAAEQVNNREFSLALAKSFRKPLILPAVPAFLLKLALGELSTTLLTGEKISNQKLLDTNFKFKFPGLTAALKDLAS